MAIRRSCLFLIGAAALAATALAAGSASGAGRPAPGAALDQSNPRRAHPCKYWGWAPDTPSDWAAQTFTAASNGTLTDVVLPLRGGTDQVTVAIAPVDTNGAPIVGSPLASMTVAFTKPATYTPIDFLFPTPTQVATGKQYAIVLSSPTEGVQFVAWEGDIGGTYGDETGAHCGDGAYGGGRAWTMGTAPLGADADLFFETYLVPAPKPQPVTPKPAAPKKPAGGTLSAVAIRSSPATPTAGAGFTVVASAILSTGRRVTPTRATCTARLAGTPLRGSGRGGCTFQIPKTGAGKRLTVTVSAGYRGKTKVKTVVYTVRRPSPAPTPTPTPPPPPPPIAQAGHYAGTTTRGTAVSFDVTSDGRYITNISVGFSLPCTPSGVLDNPAASILPTTRFGIHDDGTFTPFGNLTTNIGGAVTGKITFSFGGRFTGPGAAAGTLTIRASLTAPSALECGPVTDTWTATRTG